jgi:ABC-type hemin transport system substrate-binding protein
MTNPNEIENEIDAIRDKIYTITQKMSPRERVEYINSRARKTLQKQQKPDSAAPRPRKV